MPHTCAKEGVGGVLPMVFSGLTEDDSVGWMLFPEWFAIDRVTDSSRDGDDARESKSWNFSGVNSDAQEAWKPFSARNSPHKP